MTYTISQLAKQFSLSRSTLLYYDRIGLLSPERKSGSRYRTYSEQDRLRMEEIMRFRQAGIALREIRKLLRDGFSRRGDILRQRLHGINAEISRLRRQQTLILALLGDPSLIGASRVLTKQTWIDCLRRAGFDEAGMDRWHAEFEAAAPEAHHDFLESLGLPAGEIQAIRARYRAWPRDNGEPPAPGKEKQGDAPPAA